MFLGRDEEPFCQKPVFLAHTKVLLVNFPSSFVGSLALGKVVDECTMEVFGDRIHSNGSNAKQKPIKGLHVVDASLFPKIPRANTMALTYAVAERASHLILGSDLFEPVQCFGTGA